MSIITTLYTFTVQTMTNNFSKICPRNSATLSLKKGVPLKDHVSFYRTCYKFTILWSRINAVAHYWLFLVYLFMGQESNVRKGWFQRGVFWTDISWRRRRILWMSKVGGLKNLKSALFEIDISLIFISHF